MSKIVVDSEGRSNDGGTVPLSAYEPPRGGRRFLKILGIFAGVVTVLLLIAAVGGFFYWRHLQTTPQYSLALLVDAARRDDQAAVDKYVDTDAVVDDFVPQITDKAVELYGRGLSPVVLKRVAVVAAPVLPAVKERARAELPRLLRERTRRFENVPFHVMAAGADSYLDIEIVGDVARVSSKEQSRPLELVLKRNGDRWKVVAVKDEELARRIAERIGQQIIALVKESGSDTVDRVGRRIGLENLGDLLKKAGDIFK